MLLKNGELDTRHEKKHLLMKSAYLFKRLKQYFNSMVKHRLPEKILIISDLFPKQNDGQLIMGYNKLFIQVDNNWLPLATLLNQMRNYYI